MTDMSLDHKPNDLLLVAARVLTIIMQIAICIGGAAILVALPAMVVFQDSINAEIAAEFGDAVGAFPTLAIASLLTLALGLLALGYLFFGKLRKIVATVGEGDPFAPENANRLAFMGWVTLASQALLIPIGGAALFVAKWVEPMENADITIDAGLEIEGILLAIILFILARVFKHGAAMRDDLEGTV